MAAEIVARQFEVTPAIRKMVEQALCRIDAVLGSKKAQVFLTGAHHRVKAEIHIEFKGQKLSAEAEAGDAPTATAEAVSKLERQVQKLKGRMVTGQRRRRDLEPDKWAPADGRKKAEVEAEQRPERVVAVGRPGAAGIQTVPVVVHDFPARVKVTETHVVRSENALAKRKMSLEEAVKEMEFNNRDIYVFRDAANKINVLYRNREGKVELIEVT